MTRSEMLAAFAEFSEEDLEAGLKAAAAAKKAREEQFYFLHYLFEQTLTGDREHPVIEMPVTDFVLNPAKIAHGGVLALLCDNAMGVASFYKAERVGLTLAMNVQYHKPARGAKLAARAEVVGAGSRVNATRCEVTDDAGVLVATATGNFYHR